MRVLVFVLLSLLSAPLFADEAAEGDHFICFDLVRYKEEIREAASFAAEGDIVAFTRRYDGAGPAPSKFLVELRTEKLSDGHFRLTKVQNGEVLSLIHI